MMDFAIMQKGEPMTYGEAINWIINISADIGKAEHRDLWHYEQALSEIREMLESAQPEIIRCKDCEYEDNCDETLGCPWCFAWGDTTEHDAYCSYAKRRENG